MRRSYGQHCTLARALDVVGERWTFLIVRELLVRPKRFGELVDGLPGMGRNLLSARLQHLEAEGLVQRRSTESDGSRVYRLTADGMGLAPALTELSRWGVARMGRLRPGDAFQGQWVMGTMVATADLDAAHGVRETYEFHVEGDAFHLRVDDGGVTARVGRAQEPDLVIRTRPEVLADIATGDRSVVDAVEQRELAVDGSPAALEHVLAIFGPAWGLERAGSTSDAEPGHPS